MANSVKEIMTHDVEVVHPDTALMKAVDMLIKNNFNGLPVVDKDGKLQGIITDRDMIVRGSSIHLPTFIKLLKDFDVYKKDTDPISGEIKQMMKMKVSDVMNEKPFTLDELASINDVIDAFSKHHRINPIPVVDVKNKLVGVVSRYDVIKLYSTPVINWDMESDPRDIDQNVNKFVKSFGKRFIFVSKTRTRYWLVLSLVFALIGFLIAFQLILRISVNY